MRSLALFRPCQPTPEIASNSPPHSNPVTLNHSSHRPYIYPNKQSPSPTTQRGYTETEPAEHRINSLVLTSEDVQSFVDCSEEREASFVLRLAEALRGRVRELTEI